MALFNEILEGQLNQLLVRRLGMTGHAAPAPALSPEIWPGLVLENDRPEWAWLKGESLWSISALQVGAAGELTVGALRNPAASGVLAVIERCTFEVNTSSAVQLTMINSLTAPVTDTVHHAQRRDGRLREEGTQDSVLVIGSGDELAGTIVTDCIHTFKSPAGTTSPWFESPIILTPSRSLVWETDTNNVQTRFSFHWRERRILASEMPVAGSIGA